jgi:hypothetical protein
MKPLGADSMQITINLPADIELDDAVRQQGELKARQTYIMELLRHGSISAGYAAQNLNLSRSIDTMSAIANNFLASRIL